MLRDCLYILRGRDDWSRRPFFTSSQWSCQLLHPVSDAIYWLSSRSFGLALLNYGSISSIGNVATLSIFLLLGRRLSDTSGWPGMGEHVNKILIIFTTLVDATIAGPNGERSGRKGDDIFRFISILVLLGWDKKKMLMTKQRRFKDVSGVWVRPFTTTQELLCLSYFYHRGSLSSVIRVRTRFFWRAFVCSAKEWMFSRAKKHILIIRSLKDESLYSTGVVDRYDC